MYSDSVEIKPQTIQGESNWFWVKGDTGCFGDEIDGPMRDWIKGHSKKYFEHVQRYDTIVTGGTSCGMHARFYAKMFKHVYAFEPDPLSFHCMVNNCQYDNVYKLNAAIGPVNGIVGLNRAGPGGNDRNIGMNQIVKANEFHIPMLSIDSLNLSTCDIIQLDVEGFEHGAITGAQKTINEFKPLVIAERFNSDEARVFMRESFGYELIDISFMDAIYKYTGKLNNNVQYFTYTA